ncbi:MAG: hypothetical protein FWD47_06575 [Treponema sp.]|nr:hypothetical protein [Treponema sp.]
MTGIEKISVKKIEELFEKQNTAGAILTPRLYQEKKHIILKYCKDYYNDNQTLDNFSYGPSKKVYIEKSNSIFNVFYIRTRKDRNNTKLLIDLGIRKENALQYYEYEDPDIDPFYISYIDKETLNKLPNDVQKVTRKATIFIYKDQNPKGELISCNLQSKDGSYQEFNVTANWAGFQENHFIIFAKVFSKNNSHYVLKQIYHDDILWWIDDLFSQINSDTYSLFYSPIFAGNSMDTLHLQLIKSNFPVFEKLNNDYNNYTSELININDNVWPFPGILARYTVDDKDKILFELNDKINRYISKSGNTFNLLFRTRKEYREVYFAYRKKGKSYIKGISNDIAGFEVGGNLIIESKEEFENFSDKVEEIDLVKKSI